MMGKRVRQGYLDDECIYTDLVAVKRSDGQVIHACLGMQPAAGLMLALCAALVKCHAAYFL